MSESRKILIGMDGSEHSIQTFQWYIDNMKHDGDVILIAWNTDLYPATFGTVNLMTGDPDLISKIVHESRRHIDSVVKHLEDMLDKAKVAGRVLQLHEKNSGEAIVKAASEERADMIIVGSRGLSALRRTFLGSVSDYVLHHAHIPVVICRFDRPHNS